MNEIIVLKFGGSSLADNEKLELVAKRIIKILSKIVFKVSDIKAESVMFLYKLKTE